MTIIDSHIHLFEKPYSDLFDNSHIKDSDKGELHLYEEYREKYRIEAAFVICYDEGHCPENSAYVETLMKKRKWVYSFGYARPGLKIFPNEADESISRGHFGISCYLRNDDPAAWLHAAALTPVWDCIQDCKIPLSLTIWPHQCVELGKCLKKFPRLTILINHMGRPHLDNGKLDIKSYKNVLALSEFENVYVKLSGFYAFSGNGWSWPQRDLFPALRLLQENFGVGKLMFASDFAPVLEFNTYKQALELLRKGYAGFSENELKKIYYLNAKKIIMERQKS